MILNACILILTTANTSNIEIRAQTKAEKYRESLRPVLGLGKKISILVLG